MTQDCFNALNHLRTFKFVNQREFAAKLGISLGKANHLLKTLAGDGLIGENGGITLLGKKAIKPYKVNNAIIMAAGMASRFAPLSYEKPKALLCVKGEILIERQIRQLQVAGIKDITVVVGYMKDKFFYLAEKFGGVSIVENDDYYRYNNTSTLIRVLDRLRNTYICSSDNYFSENVFEPYVYGAYYAAVEFPGPVNEWGLEFNAKGRITGINHYPVDAWCMMGHVYFDRAFSEKFAAILKVEYGSEVVKKELWEAVYERHVRELSMSIRKYDNGIVHEFDSLDDLRQFDASFFDNTGSEIIQRICRILKCEEMDVTGIKVQSSDVKNLSFTFVCKGMDFVYHRLGDIVERV